MKTSSPKFTKSSSRLAPDMTLRWSLRSGESGRKVLQASDTNGTYRSHGGRSPQNKNNTKPRGVVLRSGFRRRSSFPPCPSSVSELLHLPCDPLLKLEDKVARNSCRNMTLECSKMTTRSSNAAAAKAQLTNPEDPEAVMSITPSLPAQSCFLSTSFNPFAV